MTTPTTAVDFFRPQPSSSWKVETALSVSAIELVSAAKSTRTKNRMPMAVPMRTDTIMAETPTVRETLPP